MKTSSQDEKIILDFVISLLYLKSVSSVLPYDSLSSVVGFFYFLFGNISYQTAQKKGREKEKRSSFIHT